MKKCGLKKKRVQEMSNISDKEKAIKEQRSLCIKIGAILVKSFTKENDSMARNALEVCVNKTSSEKDRLLIQDFIAKHSQNFELELQGVN